MQNFQLTTLILWGALHSEGGPWPPNTPNPAQPSRSPPNPTNQPLAPQQPPTQIVSPAPWQMQPWAQNQEPTQLTWTAQHNTPQGLVTSWGGYTTHAINAPQTFAPHTTGQRHATHPQFPPQASLPPQPQQHSQPPPPSGFNLPPTFPQHTNPTQGGAGGTTIPAQTPHWASTPAARAYDWDSDAWNNPQDDPNYARPIPTTPAQSSAATQPPAWLPPPGTGPLPHMLQPEYTQWISSGRLPQTYLDRVCPQPPSNQTPGGGNTHTKQPSATTSSNGPPTTPGPQQLQPPQLPEFSQPRPPPDTEPAEPDLDQPTWSPAPRQTMATHSPAPERFRNHGARDPSLGRPDWGRQWGDTPSSQRGYPFRGTPTRAAGHGRQRVDNSSAPNLDTDPDTQDHNHNRGPDDAFSRNVTHRGTPLHPPTPPTTTDKTQQPARNTTSAAESPPTKGGSENTGNESSKTRQHTCSPHAAPPKPRHHTTGGHSRTSNTARCRRRQQHLARLPTLRWHHPTRDNFPHQQRRHRLAPPQPRLLGSDHQTQREPGERLLFSRDCPPCAQCVLDKLGPSPPHQSSAGGSVDG